MTKLTMICHSKPNLNKYTLSIIYLKSQGDNVALSKV